MLPAALCLDETHGTIIGGYTVLSISTPPVMRVRGHARQVPDSV